MMRRIRIEWYIIKDVCSTILGEIKRAKSLKPLQMIYSVGSYQTDENGPVKRGTYYSYVRDFWFGEGTF